MTVLNSGARQTENLPAYNVLTIIASQGGSGTVVRLGDLNGEQSQGSSTVAANATVAVGPFATPTRHDIVCAEGVFTYGIAPVDFPTSAEALAASTAAAAAAAALVHLSVTDPEELIATVIEIIGDGAPATSARATLNVNPVGDDNGLTYTAVQYGTGGNAITIAYTDPGTAEAALAVSVVGNAITVSLETDDTEPTPVILSTAAEVLAAIEASEAASALVTVAIMTADTGSGDDGSGVVTAMAAAPLASGTGTGVGTAGPGSRYTDIDGPALYINIGTAAQPDWVALAEVA